MGFVRKEEMFKKESNRPEIIRENYKEIISLMCRKQLGDGLLETLKQYFINDINSRRSYSAINTLEDLLCILEKRNVIGYCNISKLLFIAEKIGLDQKVGSLLNLQLKLLSKEPFNNITYLFGGDFLEDSTTLIPDCVLDYLAVKLKTDWLKFARALYIIPDTRLVSITENYKDLEERARQALLAYSSEVKLQRLANPYFVLLSALEKIKRRDIKESVEKLLVEVIK